MKCITCGAEIPPEWVAAIQSGVCPGCNGPLYSDKHKDLIQELRTALEEMPNADAESISGWLLSNYELRKIGEIKPTKFHRPSNNTQSQPSGASDYYERIKVNNKGNKNLAAIAEQIKMLAEEGVAPGMYPDDNVEGDIYVEEEEEPARPVRSSKDIKKNNSIMVPPGMEDKTPLSVAELQEIASGNLIEDGSSDILEQTRLDKLRAQKQALASKSGFVRRGE